MAYSSLNFGIGCLVLLGVLASTTAFITTPDFSHPYPEAISDLKDVIMKNYGFQAQEMKITGFDSRDALVGRSISYEFGLEIDNKVLPFKLLKDVEQWEHVDLPIFKEESVVIGEENGLVERRDSDNELPVLAPFQLAGPMELWIQDGKDMRLSLPHDVDAGVLKKVILADGAVVTVKGARSVSLRHPIELPLPLNQTQNNFAPGLLTLADRLRRASRSQSDPLVSLRIVGPTSLTSPASPSPQNKLKLKLLAPGLVELSSKPKTALDLQGEELPTLAAPDHFSALWPLTSLNGSDPYLRSFEVLLTSILGQKAHKEGSFKLVKADVSAQTFVKMGFGVEKKVKPGDLEGFPEWRTKPESVRMHFEVLAKVDGDKIVPERVVQVDPVMVEDTVAPNVQFGNMTMSSVPIVHPPPSFFSL